MAVSEKWLEETDQFATAEYLQADAVIFLQARLKRLLKEYRALREVQAPVPVQPGAVQRTDG